MRMRLAQTGRCDLKLLCTYIAVADRATFASLPCGRRCGCGVADGDGAKTRFPERTSTLSPPQPPSNLLNVETEVQAHEHANATLSPSASVGSLRLRLRATATPGRGGRKEEPEAERVTYCWNKLWLTGARQVTTEARATSPQKTLDWRQMGDRRKCARVAISHNSIIALCTQFAVLS